MMTLIHHEPGQKIQLLICNEQYVVHYHCLIKTDVDCNPWFHNSLSLSCIWHNFCKKTLRMQHCIFNRNKMNVFHLKLTFVKLFILKDVLLQNKYTNLLLSVETYVLLWQKKHVSEVYNSLFSYIYIFVFPV